MESIPFLPYVKWILMISVVAVILINALGAAIHAADTGDWMPFADATVGVMFRADQQANEAINRLKTETDPILKDFYITVLVKNVMFTAIAFLLLHKVMSFLIGISKIDPLSTIVFCFLLPLFLLAIMQIGYVYFTQGVVLMPYEGLTNTLLNLDLLFTSRGGAI